MTDICKKNSKENETLPCKNAVLPNGNIIDFDDILTTTRTVIAISNLNVNIENFFKYMPITQYTPIEKKRGRKRRFQPVVNIDILPPGSIISLKFGNDIKGVVLKKKKYKKTVNPVTIKKKDDYFRHSVSCVMMLENNKLINIKVPSNGKLQMTGCKTDEHSIDAVTHLYKIMTKVEHWTNEKLFTMNKDTLEVIFNIVMQNKDFKIGFRINRQQLDTFINTKTDYFSIFEASTSTGINIKIENNNIKEKQLLKLEYNISNDTSITKYISYDEYYNLLDIKEKQLEQDKKYITFFVFSSGSIIMSGRQSNMKEIFYDVVKVLLKNRNIFEEKSDIRKVIKTTRKKIEIVM